MIFGEGNCFNESEVRKRLYGMKRLIEIIEDEQNDNTVTRVLSVSDIHYPYNKDISVFADYAGKIDILQLNGDILDCTQLSKFSKLYRSSPIEEMIGARQYIIDMIDLLRPHQVIVNHGNHEVRLGAYLAKNIDNELQELMPETAFDYIFIDGFIHYDRKTKAKTRYEPLCEVFDNVKITYTRTWYSKIGEVIFCHPKAFSSGILKTAEKALYWFRNEGIDFSTLVMSHTHRVGFYKIGNSNIYEQGACCDTEKMVYADGLLYNSQKQGFIIMNLDKNGKEIAEKTKIITLN